MNPSWKCELLGNGYLVTMKSKYAVLAAVQDAEETPLGVMQSLLRWLGGTNRFQIVRKDASDSERTE